MTFLYVSGAGSDSTEKGLHHVGPRQRQNRKRPPPPTFQSRPHCSTQAIQPLHGIQSKTASDRILYTAMNPFLPLLTWLLPQHATTTETLGRAIIRVAPNGHPKRILETRDINQSDRAS
jgi:hypothetical protein